MWKKRGERTEPVHCVGACGRPKAGKEETIIPSKQLGAGGESEKGGEGADKKRFACCAKQAAHVCDRRLRPAVAGAHS